MTYTKPPVVKDFKKKMSFVHNMIANKSKTNDEHLTNTLKLTNPRKVAILRSLHEKLIDVKVMTGLKNALFDSSKLVDSHLIPVEEYQRIRRYETKHLLDDQDELLLQEILC